MGAWIEILIVSGSANHTFVAPLVGAWIEMFRDGGTLTPNTWSLPLWERGLKLPHRSVPFLPEPVAPLVGAWIEMEERIQEILESQVAPLVGAWIEILCPDPNIT